MTAASAFLGSKHSAPLEQLKGEPLDERADVYGAGSVLFHCIQGRPMYAGMGPEGAIVARMVSGEPEQLKKVATGPKWERELLKFINNCIAVERTSRPQSAPDCIEELNRIEKMVGSSK